jgi:IPT/TIG domain
VVTITGSGFGTTQGNGTVWIGNMYGVVSGWSDTQIVASVASDAVSGIVNVWQNGVSSNAVTFTVPSSGGPFSGSNSVTLVPNDINMVVGGTQSIEALNSNGQSVTGLTWTSSNTAVATLSTDDPPIITAVGVGTATITAGNAASFVTVLPGAVLARHDHMVEHRRRFWSAVHHSGGSQLSWRRGRVRLEQRRLRASDNR